MRQTLLALGLVAGFAASAAAQAPPAMNRLAGTVTAISATSITLKGADGKETQSALAPTWSVMVSAPVDLDAIKPGSFVATANLTQPNGDGRSIELRVFEPGVTVNAVNAPMQQPGQMMTNGTVSTVSKGEGGRELNVSVPGGVRKIVVPPEVQVMKVSSGDRALVKPGAEVTAILAPVEGGAPAVTRVTITKAP